MAWHQQLRPTVDLRQPGARPAYTQSRAHVETSVIVRVLLTLFLALWLPLQGTAALAMGAWADHGGVRSAMLASQSGDAKSAHRHHAADAAVPACDQPAAQEQDAATGAASQDCGHCTLCAASAAPSVVGDTPRLGLFVVTGEVMLHASPTIADSTPDLIHRPPIAAAA